MLQKKLLSILNQWISKMEDDYYKLDWVAKLSEEEMENRIATPCCELESSNIEDMG